LREGNADIVVCHSAWSLAMFGPVISLHGVPLAFFVHDRHTGLHWAERLARRIKVNAILCNSRYVANTLSSTYPPHQLVVSHLPVPPPSAHASAQRSRLRAQFGAPGGVPVIIVAARFEPWKGHALLVHALSELPPDLDWRCWIVGGPQRPHEEEYRLRLDGLVAAASLGDRVQFLGQQTEVAELLAAADIYCQPNTGPEPFGVAFVEALHAGLPVVTTRMGAAGEILSEDCARLVDPEPGPVADALTELLRDSGLRRRLGTAAVLQAQKVSDVPRRLADIASALSAAAGHAS